MHVQPRNYFKDHPLNEGLVFQIIHEPLDALAIVVDRPIRLYHNEKAHTQERIRQLVHLQFGEIKHYVRSQPAQVLASRDDYDIRRDKVGVLIYAVKVAPCSKGWLFASTFSNFGAVTFEFSWLQVDERIVEAIRKGNTGDWIYRDEYTGEIVNLFQLFSQHRC